MNSVESSGGTDASTIQAHSMEQLLHVFGEDADSADDLQHQSDIARQTAEKLQTQSIARRSNGLLHAIGQFNTVSADATVSADEAIDTYYRLADQVSTPLNYDKRELRQQLRMMRIGRPVLSTLVELPPLQSDRFFMLPGNNTPKHYRNIDVAGVLTAQPTLLLRAEHTDTTTLALDILLELERNGEERSHILAPQDLLSIRVGQRAIRAYRDSLHYSSQINRQVDGHSSYEYWHDNLEQLKIVQEQLAGMNNALRHQKKQTVNTTPLIAEITQGTLAAETYQQEREAARVRRPAPINRLAMQYGRNRNR